MGKRRNNCQLSYDGYLREYCNRNIWTYTQKLAIYLSYTRSSKNSYNWYNSISLHLQIMTIWEPKMGAYLICFSESVWMMKWTIEMDDLPTPQSWKTFIQSNIVIFIVVIIVCKDIVVTLVQYYFNARIVVSIIRTVLNATELDYKAMIVLTATADGDIKPQY